LALFLVLHCKISQSSRSGAAPGDRGGGNLGKGKCSGTECRGLW